MQEIDAIMHKIQPKANSSRSDQLKYFVIALYRYLPPLRANDYRSVVVSTNSADYNYYNHEESKLYLDSMYHSVTRVIKFPDTLSKITSLWLKCNETGFLIPDKNGKQMSQQAFTDMLNRIFGRSVSVSEIRKNYIKRYISRINMQRREKLAMLMDHSTETQNSYIDAEYSLAEPEPEPVDEPDSEDELIIDMTV